MIIINKHLGRPTPGFSPAGALWPSAIRFGKSDQRIILHHSALDRFSYAIHAESIDGRSGWEVERNQRVRTCQS